MSKNQRKPVILHVLPSLEIGGQQARLRTFIHGSEGKIHHKLLSLSGDYAILRGTVSKNWKKVELESQFSKHLPTRLSEINVALRTIQYDGLMTYNWGSIEWAFVSAFLRRRCIVHWEDGFNHDEADNTKFHRDLLRAITLRRASRVVVPSTRLKSIAMRKWRISEKKICLIRNGVRIPHRSDKLRSDGTEFRIGTVAALRPEKNLGALIECFKYLPDNATLTIAGGGVEKRQLEKVAMECALQDRIRFLGEIDDVYPFLNTLDVFALSSLTEQLPISVLEAMACGLPIVSTDVGDIKKAVCPENQQLIVDGKSLGSALSSCVDNSDMLHKIGEKNRMRAQEYYSDQSSLSTFLELARLIC